VRIGTGDEFLRTTGGTLTGALTISANAAALLSLNRPDGAAHNAIGFQRAGGLEYSLRHLAAQPRMAFVDGADALRLTLDDSNGLLGTTLVPLSLMRRDQVGSANVGAVTILVGVTTILSLPTTVDVAIGDRILVTAGVTATKGATGGNTAVEIVKSAGTSTGVWHQSAAALQDERNVPATLIGRHALAGVWLVTGAGSLTLLLRGTSAGSNSAVAIGGAELRYWAMRDSA
jgi:hypothetical protein